MVGVWLLAAAVATAAAAVVLVAWFVERPDTLVGRDPLPSWRYPRVEDLVSPAFPIAWPGYSVDHVDAFVARVAAAFDVLSQEAGHDAVRRARARLTGEVVLRAPARSGDEGTARDDLWS